MDTREREQVVKKIVDGIINNLSDRSGYGDDGSYKKVKNLNDQKGLGDVWDEMEDDSQEELKKEWQAIVRRFLPVSIKK